MKKVIKFFKFSIKYVRTDNGLEFTNRLVSDNLILFENYLKQYNIKPYTSKHDSKAKQSHIKDSERFYKHRRFYLLEDARKQSRIQSVSYDTNKLEIFV